MASANTLCKNLLNFKDSIVESHDMRIRIISNIFVSMQDLLYGRKTCPFFGKESPRYDLSNNTQKILRGLDWGGIIVEIKCPTHHVKCEEHGIVTASAPWAYPGSCFTKEFDLTVAWLAT